MYCYWDTVRNKKKRLPLWIMRQAGRYLPEYREIREGVGGFLELCYSPELASEVTLQPIRRFGFDAAIIFSDILVIPDALGMDVRFESGKGPLLTPLASMEDVNVLNADKVEKFLSPVYEALSVTRDALDDDKALIGFVGSVWTLACYTVEGKGSKDFALCKKAAYEESNWFIKMMDILEEAIVIHVKAQIEAGAQAIQLFDSWAGILDEDLYEKWVIAPTQRIVEQVKRVYPDVPIIGFPRGSGMYYERYVDNVGVDVLGVDGSVPREWVKERLQSKVVIQGGIDPTVLLGSKEKIKESLDAYVDVWKDGAWVCNLSHGILPQTPVDNVAYLVELVHGYRELYGEA